MAQLKGTLSFSDLPPNRGLIVNLVFFEVGHPEAPPPFNGDPPVEEAEDMNKVCDNVDFDREFRRRDFNKSFVLQHRAGNYYVQARVLLFRKMDVRMLAQSEKFFFGERPVRLSEAEPVSARFPIRWPSTPLESLGTLATFQPE